MKSDYVVALIEAYVARDGDRFRRMALQLAAHEKEVAPKVHARIHAVLNSRAGVERMSDAFVPLALPTDLKSVLVEKKGAPLDQVVLTVAQRELVTRLLAEHAATEALEKHGVSPRRRLLFAGPSGAGKTMLSSSLALELGMPCLVVQLHAIVGQYMGETGHRLAKVFECMREQPGVYVIDEMDALGEQRGSTHDSAAAAAEMRRVVSGMLQLLDNNNTRSVIIGTTNRLEAMDSALVRRFEAVWRFAPPGFAEIERLIGSRLQALCPDLPTSAGLMSAAAGMSLAAVAASCDEAVRGMVLSGETSISPTRLILAMQLEKAGRT